MEERAHIHHGERDQSLARHKGKMGGVNDVISCAGSPAHTLGRGGRVWW